MVLSRAKGRTGRALAAQPGARTAPARVALTDAQERSSLAAIRCLGAGGFAVTATADRASAPGLWSRHCEVRRLLVCPTVDLEAFLCGLARILASRRHDLLIPGTDASLFAISLARERLEGLTCLALAPHEVVRRCLSKQALADAAARAGLAGPDTVLCESSVAALRAARRLGFPVLVKPDDVIRIHGRRLVRRASVLAHDESELHGALSEPGPWLVQRHMRRPIVSVAGVAIAGEPAAIVAARYLRLWPVDAGNGSFIETFQPSGDLLDAVARLLALLRWSGIFQLELADLGDRLAALDFNPRPYGSMGVARAAGVPLASIWCRAALDAHAAPDARGAPDANAAPDGRAALEGPNAPDGDQAAPDGDQAAPDGDQAAPDGCRVASRPEPMIGRAMVHYRVEDVDARHAAALLRSRRWREAAAAIAPRREVEHAYFHGDDPLPVAARALQLAGRRRPRARWR